jgi:hypothetical protein
MAKNFFPECKKNTRQRNPLASVFCLVLGKKNYLLNARKKLAHTPKKTLAILRAFLYFGLLGLFGF